MRDTNFKAGDLVRIRDWNDMRDEFGENSHGSINCEFLFVPDMKELCGREFEITDIDRGNHVHGLNVRFTISKDMIEFANEVNIEETEEFKNFLGEIKIK